MNRKTKRKSKRIKSKKSRRGDTIKQGKNYINYLKNSVKEYSKLYKKVGDLMVIDPKYIVKKKVTIKSMPNNFNLYKNGVQKIDLNNLKSFSKCIKLFKKDKDKIFRKCIRDKVELFINTIVKDFKLLGFDYGFDYDRIIVVDSVYRDTTPGGNNPFKSVSLAHTDFDPIMHDYNLVYPFFDRWGDKIEKKISDYKNYFKEGKHIVKVCNLWISLTEDVIKNDKLCFCDIQSLKESQITPYIAERRVTKNDRNQEFIAQALKFNPNNKWYTNKDIKMGQAYIFDSFKTPHASVNFNNDFSRKSIECRVIFLKDKVIPDKSKKFYLI